MRESRATRMLRLRVAAAGGVKPPPGISIGNESADPPFLHSTMQYNACGTL